MEMTETGEVVYSRTYSRTKPDGTRETWPETVERVVDGNLALAYPHERDERDHLIRMMTEFKIIPAGRHLWASGVKGRQYLFNCHVSGWGEDPWDHFEFTFLRLMEGGGVGANYSNRFLLGYDTLDHYGYQVHIVCDPDHPDYQDMLEAGVLSDTYVGDWHGAYEVEDSREGWADALTDLISTYYRAAKNDNRVFDVSRVRAAGTRLKTFGGTASGPLPLAKMLIKVSEILNRRAGTHLDGISAMDIDHAIAECVVSGGNRRSARMAIMHWADPQIADFLASKQDVNRNWSTNISVEVDDEFWEMVTGWGKEGAAQSAKYVLEEITNGMLENGEPGIWDSSQSNVGEPNPVIATNPCGEIALEPWENCNLGHISLAAFVDENGDVDEDDLYLAHKLMTRFLIRATYGDVNDEKQADTLARNRRIGVGHLGVASFLAMMGIPYSEAPSNAAFKVLLHNLAFAVDEAAEQYAHDLRIPVPVKKRTVAPTGTIAKMPGVSEGIHPIFSRYFLRRIRFSFVDPDQRETLLRYMADGYTVEDDLYADNTGVVEIPTKDTLVDLVEARGFSETVVQGADELSLLEMLSFQEMYQRWWADNAVSYTANVDPDRYTTEEVENLLKHFGPDLKGVTVFPEMSRPQSPYERLTKEEFESYSVGSVADGVDENCISGACPVK